MSDQNPAMGAKYRFVPYARHGYRPTEEFTEGSPDASAQPAIGIDVTPKGVPQKGGGMEAASDREVSLSMYGPGDVQGFDDAQIVRVEPRPGSKDFQPNYFPFVEFDRPDLPWMFSPEKASPKGRIRPWLSLITVEDTEDVTVSTGDGRPSPVLELGSGVDLATELPDLSESWAWAHVQSHARPRGASGDWYGSGTEPNGWLYEELQKTSNITRSRLLCPRNLEESTDYLAAVVPTFEPGRRAALGEDPYGGDGRASAGDVALAWRRGDLPEPPFEVPLFHHWRFKAGTAGTFEKLVDRLEPAELGPEVGRKEVDVGDPGPESLEPTANEPRTVDVGGAMYSAAAKRAVTGSSPNQPPKPYAQADRLRDLLNKPETLTAGSAGDAKFPVVGPPLYGQWHAGLEGIPDPGAAEADEYDPEWFRTLNQNVRHRVAAAVGTGIVQEYQEQLMEAAWSVVDEIREKNEVLKRTQESEVVGNAMESAQRVGSGGSDFGTDEEAPMPDARNPNAVRREFERIRRIADLSAAEGIDGIDPETPAAGTDPLAPGDGEGDPTSSGSDRTQRTDPVDFLAVGGAVDGERAGFEDLALAYAGDDDVVGSKSGTRTDGGAAAVTGTDEELAQTAVYGEYLRTFLSQPEASLQFQRLARLDGPVAKRTGATADDYRNAVERASRRAEREVETLVEAATAAPPDAAETRPRPAADPSEILPESFQESGTGPPTVSTPSTNSGSTDGPGEVGSPGVLDDETLATVDVGSRVEALAASQSEREGDPGERTELDDRVGHEPTARGSLRPATALPKVRDLETRDESARALDARLPQAKTGSPGGDTTGGETSETTLELITGIRRHCTSVRNRIEAAEDATTDDHGSASGTVLSAYEAARPIAHSLDPLGRAVAKAVADPEIGTTEDLTDADAAEAMLELRESYRSLLSALTEAHDAATDGKADKGSGEDPTRSDGTREDPAESDEGSRDPTSGSEEGTGGADDGQHSDEDGASGAGSSGTESDGLTASLDAAGDALGRLQGDLGDLQGRLGLGARTVSTTQPLRTGGTASSEPVYDPRNAGAPTLSMDAIENRIDFSGAKGYARIDGGRQLPMVDTKEFVRDGDPVEEVMVAPEFPTPTWRLLKENDPEFVLPGADSVPKHSVSLVFENREFVESYMVGLSHEVGRELLWRQYPTDRKGTYFQRFWNRGSGPAWERGSPFELGDPPTKDVDRIHEWNESDLGENGPDGTANEKLFLLVRGKLFEKFPDTVVYAARARVTYDEGGNPTVVPTTPEEYVKNADTSQQNVKFPMFRGKINEDVTFLAFDLTQSDVYADHGEVLGELYEDQQSWEYPNQESPFGWYFVFEERPGETRFGLDEGATEDVGPDGTTHDWNDISWYHTVDRASELASTSYLSVEENEPSGDWSAGEEEWGRNGAHMAGITWQQPVRVSYHAHEMLSDRDDEPSYVR